jgi:hypothetical protein
VNRDDHLKAIYVYGTVERRKRTVIRMLCSGPHCGGEAIFANGLTAFHVAAAADAHVAEAEDQEGGTPGE